MERLGKYTHTEFVILWIVASVTGDSLRQVAAEGRSLDLSAVERHELENDLSDLFDCPVSIAKAGDVSVARLAAAIDVCLGRA